MTESYRWSVRGCLLCVLMTGMLVMGCRADIKPEVFKQAIQRGNVIVAAVEAYKNKHGLYPDRLEQLVPVFLDVIPETGITEREKFSYFRLPDNTEKPYGYTLSFYVDTSISGLMVLSARSRKRLTFNSAQIYEDTDHVTTHSVVDGWAVQTISR